MIVFWSHRWDAVNNLVYIRKDLIVINSYLRFSRWLSVKKDYIYSHHKQQVICGEFLQQTLSNLDGRVW